MTPRRWDDRWHHYAESRPLPTKDGIATSKQRGKMASTWWSQRFVEVLESYGLGTRMKRGRRYARAGQVLSVEVSPGLLLAQVQGSRRVPYVVSIRFELPDEAAWERLEAAFRSRVGFAAKLLAGEVPPELEASFDDVNVPLFPASWEQLAATCSCPDWENPCKHLAAVLYVFADQLDEDPWLLLTWRGRSREELLAHLRERGAEGRADGLPVWWPLLPGQTDPTRVRWRVPNATPTTPPGRVLDRLEPLEVTDRDTSVRELVARAYVAFAQLDAEPNGPAEPPCEER